MNEFFDKLKAWYEGNKTLAMILGAGVVLLVFGKKLFRRTAHRRHHRPLRVAYRRRGTHTPVSGTRRRSYKSGAKKPWQIKGSRAAKLRMARIRRRRRA